MGEWSTFCPISISSSLLLFFTYTFNAALVNFQFQFAVALNDGNAIVSFLLGEGGWGTRKLP